MLVPVLVLVLCTGSFCYWVQKSPVPQTNKHSAGSVQVNDVQWVCTVYLICRMGHGRCTCGSTFMYLVHDTWGHASCYSLSNVLSFICLWVNWLIYG